MLLLLGVPGPDLKVYSEKKTWNEARQTCQGKGGDLVIVDKPVINEWLSQQDRKLGNLWIGASDEVRYNLNQKPIATLVKSLFND